MAARRTVTTEKDPVLAELTSLRRTVEALTHQMSLAMETLALMRADQMKLAVRAGLHEDGTHLPEVHHCADGHEHPTRKSLRHKRR